MGNPEKEKDSTIYQQKKGLFEGGLILKIFVQIKLFAYDLS